MSEQPIDVAKVVAAFREWYEKSFDGFEVSDAPQYALAICDSLETAERELAEAREELRTAREAIARITLATNQQSPIMGVRERSQWQIGETDGWKHAMDAVRAALADNTKQSARSALAEIATLADEKKADGK
jgi:hypothetical protein